MARRLLQTVACAVALRPPHQGLRQPTRRPATLAQPTTTTVEVDLGDRSYPIYIGDGLLTEDAATASQYLQTHVKGSQVLIVTNEILDRLGYTQRTKAALEYGDSGLRVETLVLPDNENEPSEATKTLENLGRITDYAIEKALDRKATFVALGGGVIGDMVGFAAACYVRGVDFIQIPTTLMAMVDSSVGGKTAVNSKSAKNMVGAFYQPVAVVADVGSLRTLPDRELASGVSEVIKYGLIRDAPFFEWLEENIEKVLERDSEALIETVEASCRNKAEVVALDEKEGGVRATLNLGHTFGHAIETKAGYGTYLHGEAVGIGMHMAAKMSRDLGWISEELFDRAVAKSGHLAGIHKSLLDNTEMMRYALLGATARVATAINRRGLAMANPVAKFKTSKGEFKVELFQDQLPITTSNFKDLATSGFYDGLTFHRVIPNFMCQFGCPNSANPQSPIAGTGGPPGNTEFSLPDGSTVKRDGGGNIPDELVGELSNEVGTISMANTGAPNSGGSQFFLNTKHNAFLDYFDNSTPSKHPVFGKVVEGMEVVKEIEGVPTDGRDKPIDAVRVETITIEE